MATAAGPLRLRTLRWQCRPQQQQTEMTAADVALTVANASTTLARAAAQTAALTGIPATATPDWAPPMAAGPPAAATAPASGNPGNGGGRLGSGPGAGNDGNGKRRTRDPQLAGPSAVATAPARRELRQQQGATRRLRAERHQGGTGQPRRAGGRPQATLGIPATATATPAAPAPGRGNRGGGPPTSPIRGPDPDWPRLVIGLWIPRFAQFLGKLRAGGPCGAVR